MPRKKPNKNSDPNERSDVHDNTGPVRSAVGVKRPFPDSLQPMLSTLVREPFSDDNWIYEVKFDGYRILASKNADKVRLSSRKLNFTTKFKALTEAIKQIQHDFVIDGEVVALNERGLPDFDALQAYREDTPLAYYVFDLLWLDGYDYTSLPLRERRERLQEIINESDLIHFSRDFDNGIQLFEAIKKQGLEGIVAKRKDSNYLPGKRSSNWLKVPTKKVQDFVIGAWTDSESGHGFRSLIFGNYVDGELRYVGHAGHGFKEQERKSILQKLKPLEMPSSPFTNKVEASTKVHWIKPVLVATIEFASWTSAGNIRKPAIFKGFRTDKDPQEVIPEEPIPLPPKDDTGPEAAAEAKHATSPPPTSADSNWPKIEAENISSQSALSIEGNTVDFYNIEREIWKGINKASLIQYYNSLAEFILPYLKDRPLSLHLKPFGPAQPGFYIKDMEGRQPKFATIFTDARKHKKQGKRDIIEYLVCNNKSTLLYLINLGCIDLNPWTARTSFPNEPDYIVIDLDPSDEDWQKVIQAGLATKEVLDKHKLKSFLKTSGKTGMHILIPCGSFSFSQARSIAEKLCQEIQQMLPDISTTEVSIAKRGNKLYLDPNQNDYADTIAAPYSVRPFKTPRVSTPLQWKEVSPDLDPSHFSIATMMERIKAKGDLFQDLFNQKIQISNSRILRRLL